MLKEKLTNTIQISHDGKKRTVQQYKSKLNQKVNSNIEAKGMANVSDGAQKNGSFSSQKIRNIILGCHKSSTNSLQKKINNHPDMVKKWGQLNQKAEKILKMQKQTKQHFRKKLQSKLSSNQNNILKHRRHKTYETLQNQHDKNNKLLCFPLDKDSSKISKFNNTSQTLQNLQQKPTKKQLSNKENKYRGQNKSGYGLIQLRKVQPSMLSIANNYSSNVQKIKNKEIAQEKNCIVQKADEKPRKSSLEITTQYYQQKLQAEIILQTPKIKQSQKEIQPIKKTKKRVRIQEKDNFLIQKYEIPQSQKSIFIKMIDVLKQKQIKIDKTPISGLSSPILSKRKLQIRHVTSMESLKGQTQSKKSSQSIDFSMKQIDFSVKYVERNQSSKVIIQRNNRIRRVIPQKNRTANQFSGILTPQQLQERSVKSQIETIQSTKTITPQKQAKLRTKLRTISSNLQTQTQYNLKSTFKKIQNMKRISTNLQMQNNSQQPIQIQISEQDISKLHILMQNDNVRLLWELMGYWGHGFFKDVVDIAEDRIEMNLYYGGRWLNFYLTVPQLENDQLQENFLTISEIICFLTLILNKTTREFNKKLLHELSLKKIITILTGQSIVLFEELKNLQDELLDHFNSNFIVYALKKSQPLVKKVKVVRNKRSNKYLLKDYGGGQAQKQLMYYELIKNYVVLVICKEQTLDFFHNQHWAMIQGTYHNRECDNFIISTETMTKGCLKFYFNETTQKQFQATITLEKVNKHGDHCPISIITEKAKYGNIVFQMNFDGFYFISIRVPEKVKGVVSMGFRGENRAQLDKLSRQSQQRAKKTNIFEGKTHSLRTSVNKETQNPKISACANRKADYNRK